MNYKVSILGKNYDLPARTLAVDEKIEAVAKIDQEYRNGEITRREAVQRLHMFVDDLAPGSLPDVEDVDTNDLMRACEDIITAYDAPARKARIEAKMAEARGGSESARVTEASRFVQFEEMSLYREPPESVTVQERNIQ